METKANYVLVGVFTLSTLICAFILVFFIGRLGDTKNLMPLDVRIPGSVTGLSEGSLVYFNGIRVGQVRRLLLDDSNPNMVIAKTEINGTTPVTRSTKATLGFQGLTGVAFIELNGGSLHEDNLLQSAAKDGAVARMDADPSTINNLLATAQHIFARADSALTELEGFVKDARGPLTQTIQNTKQFTETLKQNRENIDQIIAETRDTMTSFKGTAQKAETTMTKLDAMLSPDNQSSVVAQTKETLVSLQKAIDNFNGHIGPIANNIERFSGQGLRNVEALVTDSRRSIDRIERAITDLEQNPQRIIFGGGGNVPQYDGRTRR